MTWTVNKILIALGDKLIGRSQMKQIVCRVLLLLPPQIIKQVTSKVWIVSSPDDAWALTFKGSDLHDRHLIFLSDDLFHENENQIMYTVLHEVGHVVLDHRNSIGYEQTESEILKQESEADAFAKKYLNIKR